VNAGDAGDPLIAELANAVEKARAEFGGDRYDWHPSQWLDELLSMVRRTDDWKGLADSVSAQLQRIETWRTQVQEFLNQTVATVAERERRERYTGGWWQRKLRLIREAFQVSKEEGLAKLLAVYAEALNAWALDICSQIVSEAYPVEAADETLETLRTGNQAITGANYPQALTLLRKLAFAEGTLDVPNRANMAVFAGRIYCRYDLKPQGLQAFQYAIKTAPDESRGYAALADYHRLSGERDLAEQFCRDAFERSAENPDACIEMGLLAEEKSDWDEADEFYERAIQSVRGQSHPVAALSKMLAPLTGNFYLQLARTLKTENPGEALESVNRAIAMGVKLEGNYPERVAYRIKAEILDALGSKLEAAEAYFEAGSRFASRSDFLVAVDLLERARQLNPEHPLTDWHLADALYVASWVSEYPYVREAPAKRGAAVWDERICRDLPTGDQAWVYMTRAGLCDQLAKLPDADRAALWWQGAACLERSVLLSPSADAYARLGLMHRNLNNEANALEATRKALDLDDKNLGALDERAAILANVGQFVEAEAVIDKRRLQAPNEFADAVKAYVLSRQRKFEDALALMNSVIERVPTEIWYRDLRALCLRLLHKREEARAEYQWIWKRYDPMDATSASYFGSAARDTGNLDAAISIFEKLLNDPSQDPISVSWSLGASYLEKPDFPRAEDCIKRCVSGAINLRQLDDLLLFGFALVLEDAKEWPHGPQVREVLARFEQSIEARRQVLGQPRSAVEEMKTVLAETGHGNDLTSWREIAAYAALGRLYQTESRWSDAISVYQQLSSESARFPEARIALANLTTQITSSQRPGEEVPVRN
jgi:tetratricopeptide (TPR) repeat protein